MRSTLTNDILQKVLTLVPMTATGPEVYAVTMTTITSDSYYYLVDTLNHTKNLKLKDRPGRDVVDCYDAILVNVESLESDGAFNPEHFGYIIRILYNTSDSRFHLRALRITRRLWSLLRNLYCVTKTSCTLMILLSRVSLFKNICENTATLLIQSGGNPLLLRIFLRINIYF